MCLLCAAKIVSPWALVAAAVLEYSSTIGTGRRSAGACRRVDTAAIMSVASTTIVPFDNSSTVGANASDSNDATVELLTNLIPALMKTFLVILAGFVFGTTNLYPKENAGAIGRLCGTLLLPVSMFNAMATLIVTEEAWTFL